MPPLLKSPSGGLLRGPATPLQQQTVRSPAPPPKQRREKAGDEEDAGAPGLIAREAFMPMLSISQQDKPIPFRAFRSPVPGASTAGLQGKTFGARVVSRGLGSIPRVRFFQDSPPKGEKKEEAAGAVAERMVLWTPKETPDPEGRRQVVADADISKVLREHQRIGLQFLFDCLMGLKGFNGSGCILADDMGLGKTLQSVAVVWTLLTQGGPNGRPACRKALVVCPASLVKNWGLEIDKWLKGRCKYIAVAVAGSAAVQGSFASFKHSREHRVLIASYETFRGHASEVADAGIDLVVCDEAHKLKNDHAEVTKCISGLAAKRRLLISGTPIQNNLEEFFTLVSVANPGVFGDLMEFRKNLAAPILRGREPTASPEERAKGEECLVKVSEVTEQFILRRTNRLNAKFLPTKQLWDVFVLPTVFQQRLYAAFLKSKEARKVLEDSNAKLSRSVLGTIRKLQCLVNHPFLVRSPGQQKLEAGFDDEETQKMFAEIDGRDAGLRAAQRPAHEELSGKLLLVFNLLCAIKDSRSGDRVVIISNWTMTLDHMEKMCEQYKWPVHRLDGTMAIGKRTKLVQDFNRPENEKAFVFLLSSKAGGCGLNLIGANRLVMYDPDWNPANDHQAMARIWRDGQKKACYIYRLFTTGTIDEKVYQRQICKDGLSTMMVAETGEAENQEMKESLSADLVKDLFCFDQDTACATHDMLGCQRLGSAAFVPQEAEYLEDDLQTWGHHRGVQGVEDGILQDASQRMASEKYAASGSAVSFVMGCRVDKAALEEGKAAAPTPKAAAATPPTTPRPAATPAKASTPATTPTATPKAATAATPSAAAPTAAKSGPSRPARAAKAAPPAAKAEAAKASVTAKPAAAKARTRAAAKAAQLQAASIVDVEPEEPQECRKRLRGKSPIPVVPQISLDDEDEEPAKRGRWKSGSLELSEDEDYVPSPTA